PVRAADTTSHVAGTETALLQVALGVVLGAPQLLRRQNLADARSSNSPALLERLFGRAGGRFLLGRVIEDDRAILGSDVRPLAVELRRVVGGSENVEGVCGVYER